MNRGLLAAFGAFFIWGLFPIYWKALDGVPAPQIMAHRLVWCWMVVMAYLLVRQGPGWWRAVGGGGRLLAMLGASSVLIAANWWLYIWAVNSGHIVETSLGYFINPLVNVLLGVLVLRERLNPRQWLAVAIAAAGVLYLSLHVGRLPWIALLLALSFGTYGLIRKLAAIEAIPGLALESGILFLPALAYLLWLDRQGLGAFGRQGAATDLLLAAAGIVTAVPLVWFAYGARRIPYSTVGVMQYLAPTLQLLCGTLIFGEAFTRTQLAGFACIWTALAIYAGDGLWRLRGARPAVAA